LVRRYLPWQKKRGQRSTVSSKVGSVGEGLLFAGLLLGGSFAFIVLITSRSVDIPGFSSRTAGTGLWLSVLVLISLILIGGGGLIWTLLCVGTSVERRKALTSIAEQEIRASRMPVAREFPTIPHNSNLVNSPGIHLAYRLPCSTSTTWNLLAQAAICLMFNGLVAAMAVILVKSIIAQAINWLLLLAIVPIAFVAIRLTMRFLQQVGETVRIGPTSVEVSDLPFYPGQRYDLCLVQAGRMSLKSLKLQLACDESATFRDGTDVRVENRRVSLQRVLHCLPAEVRPGVPFVHQGELVMPEGIMHSFVAGSNSLQWKLLVEGEMQRGRKFEREFPIVVFPSQRTESG
jgi:hypothetical protein